MSILHMQLFTWTLSKGLVFNLCAIVWRCRGKTSYKANIVYCLIKQSSIIIVNSLTETHMLKKNLYNQSRSQCQYLLCSSAVLSQDCFVC